MIGIQVQKKLSNCQTYHESISITSHCLTIEEQFNDKLLSLAFKTQETFYSSVSSVFSAASAASLRSSASTAAVAMAFLR